MQSIGPSDTACRTICPIEAIAAMILCALLMRESACSPSKPRHSHFVSLALFEPHQKMTQRGRFGNDAQPPQFVAISKDFDRSLYHIIHVRLRIDTPWKS